MGRGTGCMCNTVAHQDHLKPDSLPLSDVAGCRAQPQIAPGSWRHVHAATHQMGPCQKRGCASGCASGCGAVTPASSTGRRRGAPCACSGALRARSAVPMATATSAIRSHRRALPCPELRRRVLDCIAVAFGCCRPQPQSQTLPPVDLDSAHSHERSTTWAVRRIDVPGTRQAAVHQDAPKPRLVPRISARVEAAHPDTRTLSCSRRRRAAGADDSW